MIVRRATEDDKEWVLSRIQEEGLYNSGLSLDETVIATNERTDKRIGMGRLLGHDASTAEIVAISARERDAEVYRRVVNELFEQAKKHGYQNVYFVPHGTAQLAVAKTLPFERDSSRDKLVRQGEVFARELSEEEQPAGETVDTQEVKELSEELGLEDADTKYST